MPTCVFKTEEVVRCARHALEASSWSMGWAEEEPPRPALFFVHDQGVYLMSNGEPRDVVIDAQGNEKSYTAYAAGCDPNQGEFSDWYETSRDLVGGDDFAETLPIDDALLTFCQQYEELHVTLRGNEITWEFVKTRRVTANA